MRTGTKIRLRFCSVCQAGSILDRCWLCDRVCTESRLVPDNGLPEEE